MASLLAAQSKKRGAIEHPTAFSHLLLSLSNPTKTCAHSLAKQGVAAQQTWNVTDAIQTSTTAARFALLSGSNFQHSIKGVEVWQLVANVVHHFSQKPVGSRTPLQTSNLFKPLHIHKSIIFNPC